MASVDLARRAEIGREKRARTRERLIEAASALISRSESVSVDEIVAEAGVAKGTFYVHFEDVDALWAELAERLTREFDELLQPGRLALSVPLERVAYGCAAFLEKGRREPAWAGLVGRAAQKRPDFAVAARARLLEDLAAALTVGAPDGLEPDIASEIVAGIVLRVGPLLVGRSRAAVEASVAAILRALGMSPQDAAELAGKTAKRIGGDLKDQTSGFARL